MLNVNITYSGIYKINFPNGKSYIGLSNNIARRLKEHNNEAKIGTNKYPVHQAITKYGPAILFYNVQILEYIMPLDRMQLIEREKYWISYYNTYLDKDKGYNLTPGGDGSAAGIYNHQAKFNEVSINEIYDLLINHTNVLIKDIAQKYSISEMAISEINNGKRYYNPELIYPLRPGTKFKIGQNVPKGVDNHQAKLNQKQIDEIYELLANSNISLKDIANKYKISYTVISAINRGLRYNYSNFNYPIRQSINGNSKFDIEQLQLIINDIQNTNLSLKDISQKYSVSYDTIRRINKGETYKMSYLIYPLRQ